MTDEDRPARSIADLLADVMACHVVGYGMSLDHEHAQAVIDAITELEALRSSRTLNARALADAGLLDVVTRATIRPDGQDGGTGDPTSAEAWSDYHRRFWASVERQQSSLRDALAPVTDAIREKASDVEAARSNRLGSAP